MSSSPNSSSVDQEQQSPTSILSAFVTETVLDPQIQACWMAVCRLYHLMRLANRCLFAVGWHMHVQLELFSKVCFFIEETHNIGKTLRSIWIQTPIPWRTPLRKFSVMALDQVKRGRGPVVAKTVATTIFVVFLSTVHSIVDVARREVEPGSVNPTDQVLMARHILDASLMGFILFLGLMIDRLHHYIRELRLLRKAMEAARKQKQSFDDGWAQNRNEMKAMAAEITALKDKAKTMVSESDAKTD